MGEGHMAAAERREWVRREDERREEAICDKQPVKNYFIYYLATETLLLWPTIASTSTFCTYFSLK